MPTSKVYTFNPLEDSRWPAFVQHHPQASVFHGRPWLRALQETYGYKPVAFTTSPPGEELQSAMVFCKVVSWLTSRRLVSLPFSDHCAPLAANRDDLAELLLHAQRVREQEGWKYVEVRPLDSDAPFGDAYQPGDTFVFHRLDLRPPLDALLRSFHRDSVQRKIRRAEREGLEYRVGRDDQLLNQLYRLLVLTRRRHKVPPQPIEWFRNVLSGFGDACHIRIAQKDGNPVAGILTLRHGNTLVYKYGGSDTRMNPLGGMVFLFWKTIQEAKQAGMEEFDLGRSDVDNEGLITFKDHWAAKRSTLTYWRCQAAGAPVRTARGKGNVAGEILAWLPNPLLTRIGRLLYRHIG